MKKLLIHIGYPKTATTSIQEGVFLDLHKRGLINYLGRTVKSTHTVSGISDFSGTDWVVKLRRHLLFKEKLDKKDIKLSDSKLNIISDEDLTFYKFFHKAQFGVQYNTDLLPLILKDIFSSADEVSVLMTLRNQTDLIFSCFLQKYRFICQSYPGLSFKQFLSAGRDGIDQDLINHFDFERMASLYEASFGGKVNFLFFEDLKYDKNSFVSGISNLIGQDYSEIYSALQNSHYRDRSKKKSASKLTVLKPNKFSGLLKVIFGAERIDIFFSRYFYMRNSFLVKYLKLALFNKQETDIPEYLNEDKELIFNTFRQLNLQFAGSRGFDPEKLKKYRYF